MNKLVRVSLLSLLVGVAACMPPAGYTPVTVQAQQQQVVQQQVAPEPEPEPAPQIVDNRNPAQVVVDILVTHGYLCNASGSDLVCASPDSGWQFVVWYENESDGTVQVGFDSFIKRVFGTPCEAFQSAVDDLRDDSNGFATTCEDTIQKFRLRQRLVYNATLDVPAWAADHLQRRLAAGLQLRSIHAIAKDDARALAHR
jgi:hypothetical protein